MTTLRTYRDIHTQTKRKLLTSRVQLSIHCVALDRKESTTDLLCQHQRRSHLGKNHRVPLGGPGLENIIHHSKDLHCLAKLCNKDTSSVQEGIKSRACGVTKETDEGTARTVCKSNSTPLSLGMRVTIVLGNRTPVAVPSKKVIGAK